MLSLMNKVTAVNPAVIFFAFNSFAVTVCLLNSSQVGWPPWAVWPHGGLLAHNHSSGSVPGILPHRRNRNVFAAQFSGCQFNRM